MESLEKRWLHRAHLTFYPKPGMTDAGILFGAGTMLLPRATIHPEHDEERTLALIAIAQRAPVEPRYLRHFYKSTAAWARGEYALAQFHLAYAQIFLRWRTGRMPNGYFSLRH